MKIASVRAAAIRDSSVFRDSSAPRRTWNAGTDSTSALSRYREFVGQGARFDDPWSDVVCIVTAEDGTWGMGMTKYAGPVVPIINDFFAPFMIGENVFATERLWNMMVRVSAARFGAAGLACYAISAFDLALWDLKGKLLERPVYELLGGPAREEVHCYATGNDIDWYLELGFEAIKLCALHGAANTTRALSLNETIVAQAREKVGRDFDLMIDFWPVHDAQFTVELGTRLRQYDLRWIEDYLHPEDFRGYPRVRERLPGQTLAAGERWYTDRPFDMAASGHWVDIFQPDVQWVGGVTGSLKVAAIAEAAGIDIAMHAGCNDAYGQHLCYALPGNRWSEYLVISAPGIDLMAGYRNTPGMSLPVNGKLVPSDAPGFGIELTLEMLEAAL
jgi:L-rhamnonate dehydratase